MTPQTGRTHDHRPAGSARSRRLVGALASTLVLMAGCASGPGGEWTSAWVSSYGSWPEGRAAGSYVFDRLPSQQGTSGLPLSPLLDARGRVLRDLDSASLTPLESSAQRALAHRGFFPAPVGSTPQVLVQVSQSVLREVQPNPLRLGWALSAGVGRHRHSGVSLGMMLSSDDGFDDDWPWYATPAWGPGRYTVRYPRDLGLVLRDAASSRVLYEARVQEPDARSDAPRLIERLLDAALSSFPQASPQPRRVVVSAEPAPPAPLIPPAPAPAAPK